MRFFLGALRIKDYVLSIEKVQKKADAHAAERQIQHEFKDGAVEVTSDAVTFELLKREANQYYMNFPPNFWTANIQKSADSSKNIIVQNTIRVKDKGLCYTGNVYHTTSRHIVSGENVELYYAQ